MPACPVYPVHSRTHAGHLARYVSSEQLRESLPCAVGASKQNVIRKLLFHLTKSTVSTHPPCPFWTRSERESNARPFYRVSLCYQGSYRHDCHWLNPLIRIIRCAIKVKLTGSFRLLLLAGLFAKASFARSRPNDSGAWGTSVSRIGGIFCRLP